MLLELIQFSLKTLFRQTDPGLRRAERYVFVAENLCGGHFTGSASTTERAETWRRMVRADRIFRPPFLFRSNPRDHRILVLFWGISEGSIGIARFFRTQSRATFRAIVVIDASSELWSGSNVTPFLQALFEPQLAQPTRLIRIADDPHRDPKQSPPKVWHKLRPASFVPGAETFQEQCV